MLQTTTITQKWQMTIPKNIRDALDIREPGMVLIEVVDSKKKMIKLKKEKDILDLAGFLKPIKGKNALKAREEMEKNYRRF
jgi:AbrB family looped-hinge helix DNA binding protein